MALAAAGGLVAGYLLAQGRIRRSLQRWASMLGRALPSELADLPDPLRAAAGEFRERLQRLEAELEQERKRGQAVIDAVAEAVMLLDDQGRVVFSNGQAARLLGTAQGRTGRTLAEVLRDHEAVDFVRRFLTSTRPAAASFELGSPRRPMVVQVVGIPEARGAVLTVRDLSEMKRLERSRQDLVANISHELRTPLANIKALVETLRDGAVHDPEVSMRFLERMEVEVDGLSQLVRELLELSLIESGQAALEMQEVQMAYIVEEVVARLQAQAVRAGVELLAEVDGGLPLVRADPGRLQQVLVNLVHNAIKFTPSGGRVVVGARFEGHGVHVWVADTGIGIAPEDLPRIFERLYKADRARSSSGTGLGLAIAKHIVRAHGGEIWAESQQGKGSVFHFTVPMV